MTKNNELKIKLQVAKNKGVPNADYEVEFPSGEVKKGKLDGSGKAKLTEVEPSHVKIRFPGEDAKQKEKEKAEGGGSGDSSQSTESGKSSVEAEKRGGNNSSATDTEHNCISFQDGTSITAEAKLWVGVPYLTGGEDKDGADCSGSVFGIYRDAGFPFPRVGSYDFPSLKNFQLAPDNIPQAGDVGYWPGHLMIYDSEAGLTSKHEQANGWSASHPGGTPFNTARFQWFDDHYQTQVRWYRYLKK